MRLCVFASAFVTDAEHLLPFAVDVRLMRVIETHELTRAFGERVVVERLTLTAPWDAAKTGTCASAAA